MTFEMRFAEIEIEKGVVFEFREIELLGCEVEGGALIAHPPLIFPVRSSFSTNTANSGSRRNSS